jgi:hypothetical protein
VKRKHWLLAAIFVAAVIQVIPVERTNPPVGETISAPPAVLATLRESCFACHSNQTKWPWYSHVAPISWIVTHDVNHGREELNFTRWGDYDEDERTEKIEEIWEMVEDGEMPPWFYLPLHPEATLDATDLKTLRRFSEGR